MVNKKDSYKRFIDVYVAEGKKIEKRSFSPQAISCDTTLEKRSKALADAAGKGISALKKTDYGRALCSESRLRALAEELEDGLQQLTENALRHGEILPTDPIYRWVTVAGFSAERSFHFWGRLGGLFHYFRDLGLSLNSSQEIALRQECRERAKALLTQLQEITGHAIIHVAYKQKVVERIEKLQDTLEVLYADMQDPLDNELAGPNSFQGGQTILRRQFTKGATFIACELYGHLYPWHLDSLLILKSRTAKELNLLPLWETLAGVGVKSVATRERDQRRYLAAGLEAALSRANTANWKTKPLVTLFAKDHASASCLR